MSARPADRRPSAVRSSAVRARLKEFAPSGSTHRCPLANPSEWAVGGAVDQMKNQCKCWEELAVLGEVLADHRLVLAGDSIPMQLFRPLDEDTLGRIVKVEMRKLTAIIRRCRALGLWLKIGQPLNHIDGEIMRIQIGCTIAPFP